MNIRNRIFGVFAAGALFAAAPPAAPDLKIIANQHVSISEISVDEIRSIFLGTTTSLKNSGPVRPVLGKDGENLDHFAAAYLNKSSAALETYYRSLMFTGRWSMPVAFASDREVIDYVARTNGAIVTQSAEAAQVKTLKVK